MRGELIRDAEPPDGNAADPLLREEFENGAAEPPISAFSSTVMTLFSSRAASQMSSPVEGV